MPKLLGQLVGGRMNPTQHLETQQALVKQLAEILEFVLKFDEYKVRYDVIDHFSLFTFTFKVKRAESQITLIFSFNR